MTVCFGWNNDFPNIVMNNLPFRVYKLAMFDGQKSNFAKGAIILGEVLICIKIGCITHITSIGLIHKRITNSP